MFNTMAAQRLLTSVDTFFPEELEPLTRRLWQRLWRDDLNIHEEEDLREACQESTGLSEEDINRVIAHIENGENKQRLKDKTSEAIEYGMFGAPAIVCFPSKEDAEAGTNFQLYFGSDRFHYLMPKFGIQWDDPALLGRESQL